VTEGLRQRRAYARLPVSTRSLWASYRKMKLFNKILSIVALFAATLGAVTQADASVVIAGTRVVYNQNESEVTVKLTNNGKLPGLTKVWLDKGDPDAKPDTLDVPFTITPPIMRIDPTKSQTLRVMFVGDALPADRESLFYLNVLEVPPKPAGDEASANQLQLAFRTRIKFFYRPSGLKGQSTDAPAQIVWHVKHEGDKNVVVADNPSPYFVSFDRILVGDDPHPAAFEQGGMVGPGESKAFPLTGTLPGANAKVRYTAINDYGGPQNGEARLTP
jgi:P pilus assembly chaperone PapD